MTVAMIATAATTAITVKTFEVFRIFLDFNSNAYLSNSILLIFHPKNNPFGNY